MEKVVYLLRALPDPVAGDILREELCSLAVSLDVHAATVLVHDTEASAAPSPAPAPAGERTHVALLSVWVDCYQFRPDLDLGPDYDVAAHLVVESLCEDYDPPPRAGERSPGVLTVASLNRPPGLGEAEWLHNWHEVQSPASALLQPRKRYVRNRVVQALTPGAPEVDGIVEEAWASAEVVADPMLFFDTGGDPERLGPMVEEMLANVKACLDLGRLRSTTMSEYLVKTHPVFGAMGR